MGEKFQKSDFDKLISKGTAKISQVIDPLHIQLADGRIIELAGIDFPDLGVQEAGEYALAALDVLKDLLPGKTVNIYQTKKPDWGRTNRMGYHLAHLELAESGLWVQGLLLTLGTARVRTTQRNPEMADKMYALEKKARGEKAGIWSEEKYRILSPEEAQDHMDSFQIVEGVIVSTTLKNNRLYLNFGPDWRTDFTVSIAPADKKLFTKAGLNPLSWGGKIIRARGWVRSYNGAYMEIDHPEAVELPTE